MGIRVVDNLPLLPPAQYDHPFHGRQVVTYMPYWDLAKECAARGLTPQRLAPNASNVRVEECNWLFPDPQHPGQMAQRIIAPRREDVGSDLLSVILEHATAHGNGWGQDHKGGHFPE